jgi:ankyrin repeat protein
MKKLLLFLCWFHLVNGGQNEAAAASDNLIYPVLRSGSPEGLEALLAGGLSPDVRDGDGNTLLMRAAIYGGVDLVHALLDRGMDVNATNTAGATALMRAAADPAKVKLLLERGADVNARSLAGNHALILAARGYGASEAVQLLLEAGADVKATNIFGVSPFLTAVASGDQKSVRLLLDKGAEPDVRLGEGLEAFIFSGGRTPLMWGAYRGDVPLMELLIEKGAEVDGQEALGTPLGNAAWNNNVEAARLLLARGAKVNEKDFFSGFTALHWAAGSENGDSTLTQLLLDHGAEVNAEGGEPVDAFLGVPQTPIMLAAMRGETEMVRTLRAAGATEKVSTPKIRDLPDRAIPVQITRDVLDPAIQRALRTLQESARLSKEAFVSHSTQQNCVSCHQQYLPMAAVGYARSSEGSLSGGEQELLRMIQEDNRLFAEMTLQATFHPDPVNSYGYMLFGLGMKSQPPDADIDAAIHHLLVIQGKDGQWHNNLPRPPIQTSDVGATALAIYGLKHYPFPAREREFAERIDRARQWLSKVQPGNTEERVFQLLGLVWSGVETKQLKKQTDALLSEQRADGGWAQLPQLTSDAYATGQTLYALHLCGIPVSSEAYQRGVRFLLKTQFDDGAWFVARRAFPFQPTMRSGFPHGRDGWISASGTSWAVMALTAAIEK